MAQLRIATIARERGVRIYQLQRATQIPIMTLRRYYYSSMSGLERDSGTLDGVKLSEMDRIAQVLGVEPNELFVGSNTTKEQHDDN